jgi:hypothetical protein
MLLSRANRSLLPAGVAFLLLPALAHAQSPGRPRIPPDARGFQATMMRQEQLQRRASQPTRQAAVARSAVTARAVTPALPPLQVAVNVPPAGASALVELRGPDGKVRSFPLAGGRDTVEPQQIIVRAGESVTIQVTARPPGK